MATSAAPASQQGAVRDHGFHPLRVRRVVHETAEAASFVFEVPADLRAAFAYEAGQFLTFRAHVERRRPPPLLLDVVVTRRRRRAAGDGQARAGRGRVELDDRHARRGRRRRGQRAGRRVLPRVGRRRAGGDLVAFSAGSGITPVFSLLKSALATTDRRVRLYYANRDRDAVIFAAELDALVERHPDRLEVVHHLDVERGFVDPDAVRPFLGDTTGAEFFVCGPGPFMDIVEGALLGAGVDADRIHIERFTPAEPVPDAEPEAAVGTDEGAATATRVTIELGGRTDTVEHRPGTTILQTARQMGMSPPFSCESGTCATCMAQLVEGTVKMHVNDVLTDDEVAEGWVLTCQSVPTAPTVHVVYEGS